MIKTKQQLATNLIKIYRIKIHTQTNDSITHYWVEDYGYKPFIFTKEQLQNLIYQSAKYHGFKVKKRITFCIYVRKIIDEILVKSNAVSPQLIY